MLALIRIGSSLEIDLLITRFFLFEVNQYPPYPPEERIYVPIWLPFPQSFEIIIQQTLN